MDIVASQQAAVAPMTAYENDAIVEEIRADIQRRNLDGDIASFDSVPNEGDRFQIVPVKKYSRARLNQCMVDAEERYMVLPDHPLEPSFKSLFKRATRKLIRFYVKPIVEDQNAFNASTINVLNQLIACINEQQKLLEEQQEVIAKLVDKCSANRFDVPSA